MRAGTADGQSPALAAKVQSVPLLQQVMSAVTLAELAYGMQASAVARRKQNQAVPDSLALHLAVLDWPQKRPPECVTEPTAAGRAVYRAVDAGGGRCFLQWPHDARRHLRHPPVRRCQDRPHWSTPWTIPPACRPTIARPSRS